MNSLNRLFIAPVAVVPVTTKPPSAVELSDAEIENIVRRSYQYVAMYNVNNKFAMKQGGWNTVDADTQLKDHTMREIARPNNDTLYIGCMLDLRKDPVILEMPAFDSKYVSLMITGYDHYVNVPMATRLGDFKKPEKMLLYTARTQGYKGEPVEGIDRYFDATGDFVSAVLRIMPHANEPARFKRIVEQMQSVKITTLSEYRGGQAKPIGDVTFPPVGKTDADTFENNLLEVMQFVFNHTTFDPDNELDQAVLAAHQPLGIAPGKEFDKSKVAQIDGKRFRKIAEQVQTAEFARSQDPAVSREIGMSLFQPKGQIPLPALVLQSVVGPIGLPAAEAMYKPVVTTDGKPMNAQHDYVIRMTKEELPPAGAFWSLTLYDMKNGFFIPNDHKKYSVGENAGMKLNDEGGIEIEIAGEKPEGVPAENWLPINRKDENLDVVLRIYVPDLERMKTWTPPKAEKTQFVAATDAGGQAKLTTAVARELAKEAWLFGLPLVMFEIQHDCSSYASNPGEARAPVNQFAHYRKFVDASNRSIVGFNVDNLYSLAWLDLSAEPLVLSVPAMGDRYWIMQIIDAWNGVPAAPGSRTHVGAKSHDFLIAGPDWKGVAPEGMEVLCSPTNLAGLGGRTYCAGAEDYAAVNQLQDQYKLTLLSAWGKSYTPPTNVPLKEGVDGTTLVNEQVMALSADQFFGNLNRLMATNPPYAVDAPMLQKLRPLGIAPGASFSTAALNADVRAAINEGVVQGKAAMAEEAKRLGKIVNNWSLTYDMGRYGTRYAYRAAWTFGGIGGNLLEDAFYPFTMSDADGNQLTGAHKYTLTFSKGAWPPADAFWSLTLYDMDGYLVDNPLNRYAVGDRSNMNPNPDGSLTIYIQGESPGKEKEANWLPAPKAGPFKMALRLYAPRESVRDGRWVPPAVVRRK